MGTSNDVLMLVVLRNGRHGGRRLEPVFRGDKVIVCSAGKFGERWVEIAKAYGLDAHGADRPNTARW